MLYLANCNCQKKKFKIDRKKRYPKNFNTHALVTWLKVDQNIIYCGEFFKKDIFILLIAI